MSSVPSALLEFDLPRQKIQLVMQNQHLFGCHLEETHQGAGRLARAVHERDGFGDYDCLALVPPLGHPGRKILFQGEGRAQVVGKVVGKPEPRIMPCRFVLRPGVSQPDDQTYGCSCAHEQFQKKENPCPASAWQGSQASRQYRPGSRIQQKPGPAGRMAITYSPAASSPSSA